MKIIMQQDVVKVGREGEVVTVADGYFRNYLFPRSLAVAATASSLKVIERRRAAEDKKAEGLKSQAEADAATLAEKTVTIVARVGTSDRLYGSITADDIAAAMLAQFGVTVDKRKIQLPDPIKSLGTYPVSVKLHRDITVSVPVEITKGA